MNRTIFGDCRDSMRKLIAEGVRAQMCVTSPPYWGLRDYGVAGQLGLESTPDEYVANMVEVFRLVRELLADDGVLWLNLGDSYAGGGGFAPNAPCNIARANGEAWGALNPAKMDRHEAKEKPAHARKAPLGLKPKDLVGNPWRVAFALQADGWYLRQDIIWHKPNPMPESVTDRCTKAHEYLFLLSKRERYYFDAGAIREAAEYGRREQPADTWKRCKVDAERVKGATSGGDPSAGRNKRSVWTIATAPYSEAHFATFPPALVEPCILAGSRPGDVVLDPFMGSGTVGQVAQDLGRQWIGCELNSAYGPMQERRTAQQGLML